MSVFVSHDGDGTEVYVTTATAKVTEIEERTSSVNVKLKASYLDHPLNGWLNTNDEVLNVLRESLESGKEVEVRIEAQRKPKIDKSIPIQEIRDSKTAKTDIIKKIASVNGVFTSEALTNPEDDPDTGKAKSALGRTSAPAVANGNAAPAGAGKDTVLNLLKNLASSRDVTESVLDALKAQALLAGATVQEVASATALDTQTAPTLQAGFTREAPPFKEYNGDGRLNLGNAAVAAGVGVFNYVFEKMAKSFESDPKTETVEYLTALVLSIADVIQTGSYGAGFRPDRSASSHTRVRASLFTVIDINPFPVTASGDIADVDTVMAWVKHVGAVARTNFTAGINASQQFPTVKSLISFAAGEVETKEEVKAETPKTPVSDSKPVEKEEVTSTPQTVTKPAEKPTVAPTPIVEPTVDEIAPEPAPLVEEPVVEASKVEKPVETPANADGLIRFEQKLLPPGAINSSNAPSEEILAQFKEFVIEETGLKTKAEQAQVGKLLAYTFGRAYNKVSNIPEDDLADFLDFYVSTGVENFKAVLASL